MIIFWTMGINVHQRLSSTVFFQSFAITFGFCDVKNQLPLHVPAVLTY